MVEGFEMIRHKVVLGSADYVGTWGGKTMRQSSLCNEVFSNQSEGVKGTVMKGIGIQE